MAVPGAEGRINFQGLPAGYEFTTLLDAVERTSGRSDELSPKLAQRLSELESEVEVMVFVTPWDLEPVAADAAQRLMRAADRLSAARRG